MIVYSVKVPREALVRHKGVGSYTLNDPFHAVAEVTGRHVNWRFVKMVLMAQKVDTISSEFNPHRFETVVHFERKRFPVLTMRRDDGPL